MRHFLPSVSAAINSDKDRRDYLGRWAVGLHQSSDYVRASRQIVTNIQLEVSKAICTGVPPFDESELLKEFWEYLEARGVTPGEWVPGHQVWRQANGVPSIGMTWPTVDQTTLEGEVLTVMDPSADPLGEPEVGPEDETSKLEPLYFVVISRRSGSAGCASLVAAGSCHGTAAKSSGSVRSLAKWPMRAARCA